MPPASSLISQQSKDRIFCDTPLHSCLPEGETRLLLWRGLSKVKPASTEALAIDARLSHQVSGTEWSWFVLVARGGGGGVL